ncbi:hypothetical protein YC2023_094967 [Brassica napus]
MISGYGNLEMASGFFQTALVRGFRGSVITTRNMKGNKVKLAEVFKDKSDGLKLYRAMLEEGIWFLLVWTGQCTARMLRVISSTDSANLHRELGDAFKHFKKMKKRDTESWPCGDGSASSLPLLGFYPRWKGLFNKCKSS